MKNRPSIWPKLKSFRNSYLALATVLAILLQFTASAQVDTLRVRQKINAYGYDYKNVAVDSSLKLPVDTFRLRVTDKGSIAYKDSCLYVWTGSRWRSIWCDGGGTTGGGGGGPTIAVEYGYSATNPYVDNSTAPTISNSATSNITSGADLSLTFAAAASGKYIVIKEPSTEPIKTKWFVEALNSGDIPDQAFRAAFVVAGFRYYVTRDAAGFVFDTSKPLQLLKN